MAITFCSGNTSSFNWQRGPFPFFSRLFNGSGIFRSINNLRFRIIDRRLLFMYWRLWFCFSIPLNPSLVYIPDRFTWIVKNIVLTPSWPKPGPYNHSNELLLNNTIRHWSTNNVILCTNEILDSNSIILGRQLSFPIAIWFLISHRWK